jgi:hypothetical protein
LPQTGSREAAARARAPRKQSTLLSFVEGGGRIRIASAAFVLFAISFTFFP